MASRCEATPRAGRDIAYYIDGVPLNEVSSLSTPNYADLNVLLPETVKSIEIVRGPFSVEFGDSNMGGSINITTKQSEPFASVGVSGGTQGTARGVATYSTTQGAWLPYLALEGYHTDGYRDNSFVDRYNSFNKITTTLPDGATVSIRAQAYGTEFGAPGYANRDAVLAGRISERSATEPTDGGNKQLENIVTTYASGAQDQELKGTLFLSHQFQNRFADFGGGQRVQHEDRIIGGGRVSKVWTGAIGDDIPVQVLLGSNWRTDVLEAFQAPTRARAVRGPAVINVGLTETNVAGFGQVQVKPLPWLKFTAGGRYDQFYYDIDDRITPGGTPNISNGIASPKAGVAITPVKWLELFANYGEGFRSIDVPAELIGNPGIQPFRIVSREGGFQTTFDRFRFLASYWNTEVRQRVVSARSGIARNVPGQSTTRWLRYRRPVFFGQGSHRQRVAVRELRRGAGAADRCSTILFRAERPELRRQHRHRFQCRDCQCADAFRFGLCDIRRQEEPDAGRSHYDLALFARDWQAGLFLARGLDRLYTGDLVSRRQPE